MLDMMLMEYKCKEQHVKQKLEDQQRARGLKKNDFVK